MPCRRVEIASFVLEVPASENDLHVIAFAAQSKFARVEEMRLVTNGLFFKYVLSGVSKSHF